MASKPAISSGCQNESWSARWAANMGCYGQGYPWKGLPTKVEALCQILEADLPHVTMGFAF